jgi:hypothetical protein
MIYDTGPDDISEVCKRETSSPIIAYKRNVFPDPAINYQPMNVNVKGTARRTNPAAPKEQPLLWLSKPLSDLVKKPLPGLLLTFGAYGGMSLIEGFRPEPFDQFASFRICDP